MKRLKTKRNKIGFSAVILAAGKGKRMKSGLPKVLHEIAGEPLLFHALNEISGLKKYIKEIIFVVGFKAGLVEKETRKFLGSRHNLEGLKVKFVYQKNALGTANALGLCLRKISEKNVIVLCGDAPLITHRTLRSFMDSFLRKNVSCSFITARVERGSQMGVVQRDGMGNPEAIREQLGSETVGLRSGLSTQNKPEVNSGIYCFKTGILSKNLSKIKKNKVKNEYFLTDIIEILYKDGNFPCSYRLEAGDEIMGINTPQDLSFCEKVMRMRILERLYEKGVKIIDPDTTFIQTGVKIGKNTVIYPFTFIEKDVIIGNNCLLGPFLHIRGGTRVGSNTHLGNFSEINRTKIGSAVRVKHFGYLGDAYIDDDVNIGAGTVTANFDGKGKHPTVIGKGAFVGSDSILIAPVKIGPGAITGAGSVVNRNVKKQSTVAGVPARYIKKKG